MCILNLFRVGSSDLSSWTLLRLPLHDAEPLSMSSILLVLVVVMVCILLMMLAGCWEMKVF